MNTREKNDGLAVGHEPVLVLPFSPVEREQKQALNVVFGEWCRAQLPSLPLWLNESSACLWLQCEPAWLMHMIACVRKPTLAERIQASLLKSAATNEQFRTFTESKSARTVVQQDQAAPARRNSLSQARQKRQRRAAPSAFGISESPAPARLWRTRHRRRRSLP